VLAGRLALLGALIAFAALTHRVADAIRGSPVREVVATDDAGPLRTSAPGFPHRAAALSQTALGGGNTLEVLVDAALFDRLLDDLRTARVSLTLMGYYCEPGRLGDRLAEILAERARAGVQVRFLGDGFGCRGLLRAIRAPLEEAGAEVATFRPVRWYSLHRGQHRMHARSVVIDGATAYTGGFGIADKWIRDVPGDPLWRDTGVRVTGPAARAMQAAFLAAWAEATGELLVGESTLPSRGAAAPGDVLAGFLYSAPGIGTSPAERYLAVTLAAAERTLFVANSYFVPTPLMRRLLVDAARRGVDVRVLLPGERTDIPSTRYAGRGFYDELLMGGVRVFEYQPAMMHAKTLVVDGTWVALGSLNLDNRSLRLNDEAALLAWDEGVGAVMDSLFLADLSRAREITIEAHRERPFHERVRDRFAALFAALL
jgi:cardiolipin synthase A/B